jgi:hypothetical protein
MRIRKTSKQEMKLNFTKKRLEENLYYYYYYYYYYCYLGSILEATGASTLEIEKRISEGRRVIGLLNSCLVEQKYPSQNQKNSCTRL